MCIFHILLFNNNGLVSSCICDNSDISFLSDSLAFAQANDLKIDVIFQDSGLTLSNDFRNL